MEHVITGTTPLILPAACFPPINAFLHHVTTLCRSIEVVFFACEDVPLATAAIVTKSELYKYIVYHTGILPRYCSAALLLLCGMASPRVKSRISVTCELPPKCRGCDEESDLPASYGAPPNLV